MLGEALNDDELLKKLFIGLNVIRVRDNTLSDRTNRLTRRFLIVPFTLSAQSWVDLKDRVTHCNRSIWALRVTHVTVNALVSNQQCHRLFTGWVTGILTVI